MALYSGAGHDAQYTADMLPTGMIFVPSKGGRSHCAEEYTPLEEAWQGLNTALNTVLELDKK
jgi:N-carbamoyl-L-amino-acid hydrolase